MGTRDNCRDNLTLFTAKNWSPFPLQLNIPGLGAHDHDLPELGADDHDLPELGAYVHDLPELGTDLHDLPELGTDVHDLPELGQMSMTYLSWGRCP